MKVTLKDSKKKTRTLKVIYGFINDRGDVVARVKTDKGCIYFTKSFDDGRFECSCPSYRCCWHVEALNMLKRAYRFNQDGLVMPAKPAQKQVVKTEVPVSERGSLNGYRQPVAATTNDVAGSMAARGWLR